MNYNDRVHEKLSAEYNRFMESMNQLSVKEAMMHSSEKIFKEDIVMCFEEGGMDLSPKQTKALLAEKYPLEHLYQEWLGADYSYLDMLRDCISDGIKSLEKELKQKSGYER